MAPEQPSSQPKEPQAGAPSGPEDAVGRRVSLYWQGGATWHLAEVMAYNPRTERHHLLYMDGEDEWVELGREVVAWVAKPRGPVTAIGIIAGGRAAH
jgi:hypothetical protein